MSNQSWKLALDLELRRALAFEILDPSPDSCLANVLMPNPLPSQGHPLLADDLRYYGMSSNFRISPFSSQQLYRPLHSSEFTVENPS